MVFDFRLSEKERKLLQEKADHAGLSPSAYLRAMIRGKPREFPEIRKEMQFLRLELSRIGNNINQIARAENAYLFSAADKKDLKKDMDEIQTLLKKYLDEKV